jgi:hypothetical protein
MAGGGKQAGATGEHGTTADLVHCFVSSSGGARDWTRASPALAIFKHLAPGDKPLRRKEQRVTKTKIAKPKKR